MLIARSHGEDPLLDIIKGIVELGFNKSVPMAHNILEDPLFVEKEIRGKEKPYANGIEMSH